MSNHKKDGAGADNHELFMRLFVANERRVRGYIRTLISQRADAEDVFQETSVTLWEKFDGNEPPTYFGAWACRIAYYKVLELRKRKKRHGILFSEEVLAILSASHETMTSDLAQRHEALMDCIQTLPSRDQELLAERLKPDATTESTAAAVGRSTLAVYKALSRSRKSLFRCINLKLAEA